MKVQQTKVNEEICFPNGIVLCNDVSYQTNSSANDKLTKRILSILNAFLGMFSSFYLFQGFFDISYSPISVFAMILFTVSLFSSIYIIGKYANFAFIPIALILFLIIRKQAETLLEGIVGITEHIIDGRFGSYYEMNSVIMLTLFLSGIIVTFFTVYHPNGICEMLLSAPIVVAGLLLEREVHYFWLIMLICHIIITFVMQVASYYQYADTGKSNFIRMGDSFFAKSNFRVNVAARAGLIAAGIAFVIISLISMYINTGNYERPQRIKILRSNLIDAGNLFDINDLSGSLQNFVKAFGKYGLGYIDTSVHGNLGLNGEEIFEFIPVAELTTTSFKEPLYLKQWTGGVYTGTEFKGLSKKAYEAMPDLKISPQNFYEEYYSNYYGDGAVTKKQVYVNYKSLLKGTHEPFLPDFILKKNKDFTPVKDTTFKVEDTADYEFHYLEYIDNYNSMRFDKLLEGENYLSDFRRLTTANDAYRDWVYENYLALPDTEAMEDIREKSNIDEWIDYELPAALSSQFPHVSLSDMKGDYPVDILNKLNNIRNWLQEERYYSLNAGVTPKGEDFVEYFLFTQKKGSCTYFASAGFVLSRMAGIPTRYCEGLVAVPSDYENSRDYVNTAKFGTSYRKFTLNDMRFHAWVEVFVDGQGWIPFEFTPGYSEDQIYAENPPEPPTPVTTTRAATSRVTRTSNSTTSRISGTSSRVSRTKASTTTTETITVVASVKKDKKPPIDKTLILAISLIVISISLPIFLILLRRLKLKGKYLAEGENNHQVLVYYLYIIELLKFIGIERGSKDYPDFANELEHEFAPYFQQATDIALKAKYSSCDVENQEVTEIKNTSETISKELFEKQKKFGKINMWLNGLV